MRSTHFFFTAGSQKGTARAVNKDGIFTESRHEQGLFICAVFDGVSSSKNARNGVNLATRFLAKNIHRYIDNGDFDIAPAIFDLNSKLLSSKYLSPETTIALATTNTLTKKMTFATLGDTRVYGITKQYIIQKSIDDRYFGSRNVISKYLGKEDLEPNDIKTQTIDLGLENALICTDGFYSEMETNIIKYHDAFLLKTEQGIKKRLLRNIDKNNTDDASFIYLGFRHV